MFTYKNLQIISAVPFRDIERYFNEIDAIRNERGAYALGDIEIWVDPCEVSAFEAFDIPRHKITVTGDRDAAEKFLTAFRLRFLSLGG